MSEISIIKEITISDIINIVLMLAYVLATILICAFNGWSAMSSKKQVIESQKQFKEINAAQVMITFKSISFDIFAFVISNLGNNYAKNVKVKCSQNIIDVSKHRTKESFEQLCQSTFVLAPKQEFTLLLFPNDVENLFNYIVDFNISYDSGNDKINSKITIDLSQYAWAGNLKSHNDKFIEETLKFEEKLIHQYKESNDLCKDFNNNFKYLNNEISVQSKLFLENLKIYFYKNKIDYNKNLNSSTKYIIYNIEPEEILNNIHNFPLVIRNIFKELKSNNLITNNSVVFINNNIRISLTSKGIDYLNKAQNLITQNIH